MATQAAYPSYPGFPSYPSFPSYPGTGFSAAPTGFAPPQSFTGFQTPGAYPVFPRGSAPPPSMYPGQPASNFMYPGQTGSNPNGYTMPSNIPGYPIVVGPVINPVQPTAPSHPHAAAPAQTPLDITDPEQWAHKLTLYPDKFTHEDELLLQKLAHFGPTAGQDGLPGFPYIGAPYIGVYNDDLAPPNEPQDEPFEDDVRGTQV